MCTGINHVSLKGISSPVYCFLTVHFSPNPVGFHKEIHWIHTSKQHHMTHTLVFKLRIDTSGRGERRAYQMSEPHRSRLHSSYFHIVPESPNSRLIVCIVGKAGKKFWWKCGLNECTLLASAVFIFNRLFVVKLVVRRWNQRSFNWFVSPIHAAINPFVAISVLSTQPEKLWVFLLHLKLTPKVVKHLKKKKKKKDWEFCCLSADIKMSVPHFTRRRGENHPFVCWGLKSHVTVLFICCVCSFLFEWMEVIWTCFWSSLFQFIRFERSSQPNPLFAFQ